uniref:Secreted protein n=1 Tax=Peronospora matthiolae TaxID=2874970 RepID=A0AAV1TLD5_9STRA
MYQVLVLIVATKVAAGFVQRGTLDPRARQREQGVVGESRRVVDELVHAVHGLRDRVARLKKQSDLLLRVPRLVALPTLLAQAPRDPPATDPGKA